MSGQQTSTHKAIVLSVTKLCSLHCVYCRSTNDIYDRLGASSSGTHLALKDWDRLIALCKTSDCSSVLLTGGEPVEYLYLNMLLQFLHVHGLNTFIHSNGTSQRWNSLLDFLYLKNVIKPGIILSVELFEDLQRELRNSSLPMDLINTLVKNGFYIELKVVLHNKLRHYVDHFRDSLYCWAKQGIESIRFQPLVPLRGWDSKDLELDPSFVSIIARLRELKANDVICNRLIRNSSMNFEVTMSYLNGDVAGIERAIYGCPIKDTILFVNTDLDVMDCRSLWCKSNDLPCIQVFDWVCCGLQP